MSKDNETNDGDFPTETTRLVNPVDNNTTTTTTNNNNNEVGVPLEEQVPLVETQMPLNDTQAPEETQIPLNDAQVPLDDSEVSLANASQQVPLKVSFEEIYQKIA